MDYDEDMIKRIIAQSGQKEDFIRKIINELSRFTAIPTTEIMKVVHRVIKSVDKAVEISDGLDHNTLDDMSHLVTNTFIMSVIGSMMNDLNISEEEMKGLMAQVYDQVRNMNAQKNQKV